MFGRKRTRKKKSNGNIDPDEIFLDSSNLPQFDKQQFEGRIERPIGKKTFFILGFFLALIFFVISIRAFDLDVLNFSFYSQKSANNRLRKDTVFAYRGVVTDRNGVPLAWNDPSSGGPFPLRKYTSAPGFSLLLGFVRYPRKDSSGFYYDNEISGQDGIEKYFDSQLAGQNGVKLTEVDSAGKTVSQSVLNQPKNGDNIKLSIDAGIQEQLFNSIKSAVDKDGFLGGAAVIMDAKTGEVIAITSYPEYSSQVMTDATDTPLIDSYLKESGNPFLNMAVYGLFAPGSTIKPYLATAALKEGTIDPSKKILSTGELVVPNPYDPSKPNIFKDWKVNGWTNMEQALAVSSDVYFYELGGGYKDQVGLGISRIDEYLNDYLFGTPTQGFFAGPTGNISSPEWKEKNFDGASWLLGDTYHTAIGQYGTTVTPLQLARALTGIVNNGTILEPVILKGQVGQKTNLPNISASDFQVVKDGMRLAVTSGTGIALNIPGVEVAAKTGTAQLGLNNEYVHSWVEGFFPYNNPRYTFALILESGPDSYQVSSMRAMSNTISWIVKNEPNYLGNSSTTTATTTTV